MSTTTANEKITVGEIKRAIVEVSNQQDAERTRDISAEVEVSGQTVRNIQNGIVKDKGSEAMVASFQQYAGGDLSVTFNREEERVADMEAITAFIADVKAHQFNL